MNNYYIGSSCNLFYAETENGKIEPLVEVILLRKNITYKPGVLETNKSFGITDFRFFASPEHLRHFASNLNEYADHADKSAARLLKEKEDAEGE